MTDPTLRFAEVCAGAGGLSMGLERAGWACAFHVEIAASPRAILTHHWPDVPLYGDLVALSGGRKMKRWLRERHAGAIDLVSGGTPCQDLSVAGKRAGLGGARSSLFYRLMRLWKILDADLCLWENVDGARSSNNGRDFGEVLRAFVGASVIVPSDGWRSAGVAAGPTGVAAWRVLDAQFFGVPQRRRRIFVLGTRTGRVDPAEVLSLAEGLYGNSPTRREAREGTTADAPRRAAVPLLEVGKRTGISTTDPRAGSGIGADGDPMYTLQAGAQHGVVSFDWQKGNDKTNRNPSTMNVLTEQTNTLGSTRVPAVVAYAFGSHASCDGEVTNASHDAGGPVGFGLTEELTPALRAGRTQAICLTGEVTHSLTHEGHDASEDGTGRGTPIVAAALTTNYHSDREGEETKLVVGTMNGLRSWSAQTAADGYIRADAGVPRRLTPRECERLMGWPDDHTLVPDAKGKPLSDAARYKACGNGVASPVAHWIGEQLAKALGAGVTNCRETVRHE